MRSAISSSSLLSTSTFVATVSAVGFQCRAFTNTTPLLQQEKIFLDKYQREAFMHIQDMKTNTTYPGPIRAATPGDTTHTLTRGALRLRPGERSYWRPVVDDVMIEDKTLLRVRFKDQVWVTNGWETRMSTVEAVVSRTGTIADLIRELRIVNVHPHLVSSEYIIVDGEGKALPNTATIEECGLGEDSTLYAVDTVADHIAHLPEGQLKDPNVDAFTDAELRDPQLRYRDLGMSSHEGDTRGRPLFQANPARTYNFGRF